MNLETLAGLLIIVVLIPIWVPMCTLLISWDIAKATHKVLM